MTDQHRLTDLWITQRHPITNTYYGEWYAECNCGWVGYASKRIDALKAWNHHAGVRTPERVMALQVAFPGSEAW